MTNSDEGAIHHSRVPAGPPPDWTMRTHRPPSPDPATGAAGRFPAVATGSAPLPVADPISPGPATGPFPPGLYPYPVGASAGGGATPPRPPAFTGAAGPRRTPRWRRGVALAGVAALLTVSSGAIGAASVTWLDRGPATASTASGTPVTTVANGGTTTIAGVVKAVDAQVVSLDVRGGNTEDLGSGVVVRSNGLILTNNHVIAAADGGGSITVTFTDGTTVPATVVAADARQDLAVIQASGVSGRSAATFADSDALRVGDTVVAIGNELGLSNSVTAGIVSALHRQVTVAADETGSRGTTYPDAIQTDASINQGDSGGALYNLAGQVVGINTAIATASSTSTGSVGVGFAISSADASAFVDRALGTTTS